MLSAHKCLREPSAVSSWQCSPGMGFHDQSFLTSASCGQSSVWRPCCGTWCEGVGQSPNCSALAKYPWVTIAGDSSAGGVGGTVQCRVGHQVLCHLCLNQLCLALAAQPPPQLPCFLTPHFGFPSAWVPLLPLSSVLSGSGCCPSFQLIKSPV